MASQLLPAGFSEPDLSPNEANLGLTFKDSAAGDYPTQVSVGRLSRMLSADDTSQAADESTQIERKQANIIRGKCWRVRAANQPHVGGKCMGETVAQE